MGKVEWVFGSQTAETVLRNDAEFGDSAVSVDRALAPEETVLSEVVIPEKVETGAIRRLDESCW